MLSRSGAATRPSFKSTAFAALLALLAISPAADAATNEIATVAGTGDFAFNGDGIPAVDSNISVPIDVATTAAGELLIADEGNNRIRQVDLNGIISTVAGDGQDADGGEGPASAISLKKPLGVAPMPDGGFLVADYEAHKVRRVLPNQNIVTVAGTGVAGKGGENVVATTAPLDSPPRAVRAADGSILVIDQGNHRIRKIATTGRITTIAGTGTPGYNGDNKSAKAAQLNFPSGIAVTADGGYLIADAGNNRIRKVSKTGTITTVAGNGTAGSFGDGVAATSAQLNNPADVAEAPNGDIVIADTFSHLIRVVDGNGVIRTLAGVADSQASRVTADRRTRLRSTPPTASALTPRATS